MNSGTEADAIGWEYSSAYIDKLDREQNDTPNEFESMLLWHGFDDHDWLDVSNNEQRRMWDSYHLHHKKKKKPYAPPKPVRGAKQTIICKCGCGRSKEVRTADVKRGWGKYFSKSCRGKNQTHTHRSYRR